MSAKYEGEQKSLLEEVNALETSITDNENQLGGVDKFIELTKQHLEFREVTPALMNAFIDKIIVHEPEKKRGANRNQFVEIIFNFVGPVEIDETFAKKVADEYFVQKKSDTALKIAQ